MTGAHDDVWTVKAALEWTVGYLERKGDENPRLSAEWLLAEACGMRRIELYVSFDRPLAMSERDVLRGFVARRGAGEPLQYITGEAAFRHIAVKVRPGVLIPRPETEVLVSEGLALLPAPPKRAARDAFAGEGAGALTDAELFRALFEDSADGADDSSEGEELPSVELGESAPAMMRAEGEGPSRDASAEAAPEALLVADLCTGSGCIACSIASEHPLARVVATDLSPEAVALARENASALGLDDRVRVLSCDLAGKIGARFDGRFDLVISNPPYVPTSVLAGLSREVADFEPALALDGGADGNGVFRRILPEAQRLLKAGGGLAVELHETCFDAAAGLARAAGFADVRIVDDLAGRPRVLVARKP